LALQWLARMAEVRSAETVAELEILIAVLRRELWRERRRLSLTVHGPIQSALVAAAVTLSRPGFVAEQIPALAGTLDQAMAHIDRSAGAPPPIEAAARDLSALWVDSAHVDFRSSADVSAAIDADEALRAVVIEVMREGVSNAIRHGSADRIDIALSRPRPEVITVMITDDGDGAPSSTVPGLGSAMFDEVALGWCLARHGTGTHLEVELAIGRDVRRFA
jgi:anti-sigma regulatory factor (Ser/Thr protein kinase)